MASTFMCRLYNIIIDDFGVEGEVGANQPVARPPTDLSICFYYWLPLPVFGLRCSSFVLGLGTQGMFHLFAVSSPLFIDHI